MTSKHRDFVECDPPRSRRALVAFGGQVNLKTLRFLHPDFRHCFAVVESQGTWVVYNPLSIGTQLDIWPCTSKADVQRWLEMHDFKVIEVKVMALDASPLPWAPFSCVEAIKRVLGVRAPWIVTPLQLYRYLNRKEGKKSLTIAHI